MSLIFHTLTTLDNIFLPFLLHLYAGDIDDFTGPAICVFPGKAALECYALLFIAAFHIDQVAFQDDPVMNPDLIIDDLPDVFVRGNDVVIGTVGHGVVEIDRRIVSFTRNQAILVLSCFMVICFCTWGYVSMPHTKARS